MSIVQSHIRDRSRLAFWAVFVLIVFSSCSRLEDYHELSDKRSPLFVDDLDSASLLTAVDRHLQYLTSYSKNDVVPGLEKTTYGQLSSSLQTFRRIISSKPTPYDLDTKIRDHFTAYQAAGRKATPGKILLTGYYTPVFDGSLTKKDPFIYPLYSVPDSLVIRKNPSTGKQETGRKDSRNTFLPFWTRSEIERGALPAENELVYLRDPLDAYLIHIQGSGKIRLRDGSIQSIGFAASNGHRYRSLGKLFVDRGLMERNDVSIPAIRDYFTSHPHHIVDMLNHNPRYIFFAWADSEGPPRGSIGVQLTSGRSVAVDHTVFPTGAIGYLVSRRPVLTKHGKISHWKTFSRFVMPQDSGAAIKGSGRIDLFLGTGDYAEIAASHMQEEGKFFILVQNNFELE